MASRSLLATKDLAATKYLVGALLNKVNDFKPRHPTPKADTLLLSHQGGFNTMNLQSLSNMYYF